MNAKAKTSPLVATNKTEETAGKKNDERAKDVCDLWSYIDQVVEVLASANESLCGLDISRLKADDRDAFDRAHMLLLAAQTVSERLALKAGIR